MPVSGGSASLVAPVVAAGEGGGLVVEAVPVAAGRVVEAVAVAAGRVVGPDLDTRETETVADLGARSIGPEGAVGRSALSIGDGSG